MSAAKLRAGRAYRRARACDEAKFLKGLNQIERTFAKKMQAIQKSGLAFNGHWFWWFGWPLLLPSRSAGDLERSQLTKMETVFGPASKTIETFAKTSANKFRDFEQASGKRLCLRA